MLFIMVRPVGELLTLLYRFESQYVGKWGSVGVALNRVQGSQSCFVKFLERACLKRAAILQVLLYRHQASTSNIWLWTLKTHSIECHSMNIYRMQCWHATYSPQTNHQILCHLLMLNWSHDGSGWVRLDYVSSPYA